MLYYLIAYLEQEFQPPGFQVVQFITVRAALAVITALLISLFVGRRIILWLRAQQLGERVREGVDAGAIDHSHKAGTPTMGGVIILLSMLGSTLLWGALTEVYVWLILLSTAWMGAFGFADDYIKVVKKNKGGLPARTKVIGQVSLGLLVGATLYLHPDFAEVRALTYAPFIKGHVLNYDLVGYFVEGANLGWLVYIPVTLFIVTAVSNGVNLTDGLDGLAAGVTAFVALGLTALSYIAGNTVLSEFLGTIYLAGAGELTIFAASMAAACLGFLWYNANPASVFMGDTGSLALGAAVGVTALLIRMELLLPLLCFVFFLESLSVIIQTTYFKYTRRRTGTGRRVFRMAPLHHHYEVLGVPENKIVVRFWIVTAITVIAALLILRIR
ncbi:MAG: phospho-N-acetylmuramoyl-pentapeptide-transferase [Bacteroidota bacterium]